MKDSKICKHKELSITQVLSACYRSWLVLYVDHVLCAGLVSSISDEWDWHDGEDETKLSSFHHLHLPWGKEKPNKFISFCSSVTSVCYFINKSCLSNSDLRAEWRGCHGYVCCISATELPAKAGGAAVCSQSVLLCHPPGLRHACTLRHTAKVCPKSPSIVSDFNYEFVKLPTCLTGLTMWEEKGFPFFSWSCSQWLFFIMDDRYKETFPSTDFPIFFLFFQSEWPGTIKPRWCWVIFHHVAVSSALSSGRPPPGWTSCGVCRPSRRWRTWGRWGSTTRVCYTTSYLCTWRSIFWSGTETTRYQKQTLTYYRKCNIMWFTDILIVNMLFYFVKQTKKKKSYFNLM